MVRAEDVTMGDKLPPDRTDSNLGRVLDAQERRGKLADVLRSLGPLPPMLRPTRVAFLLDVPRQRVYEMIAAGTLEHVRLGGRSLRVTRDGLERFLAGACGVDLPVPTPPVPTHHSRN